MGCGRGDGGDEDCIIDNYANPTQPRGQIFESGDTTTRGTLTEKDFTSTRAKAAHN
jgi:hypothetical protein